MAKKTEFEVSTDVRVKKPAGFLDDVVELGSRFFDKSKNSGIYIGRENELGRRAKEKRFWPVEEGSLRYFHFDRVVEPLGALGIQFVQLALTLDPALQKDRTIGGLDIIEEVKKDLALSGVCLRRGEQNEVDFNVLDAVPSSKHDGHTVFVLRQMPELQTETRSVSPLGIITDSVRRVVQETNPEIFNLAQSSQEFGVSIENSVPIGRTIESNTDKIQEFKEEFSKHFFEPAVTLISDDLSVRTIV